jgi:hypothetical protein
MAPRICADLRPATSFCCPETRPGHGFRSRGPRVRTGLVSARTFGPTNAACLQQLHESPGYEGHSLRQLRKVATALNARVRVILEPLDQPATPAMVKEAGEKYFWK